jgi:hypothetical protein
MDISFADRWFTALDQRQIGSGASGWVAQVLGVHTERDGLWVQLAPAGDLSATVVLHVSQATHLDEVVKALERRGRLDRTRTAVIDLLAGALGFSGRPS